MIENRRKTRVRSVFLWTFVLIFLGCEKNNPAPEPVDESPAKPQAEKPITMEEQWCDAQRWGLHDDLLKSFRAEELAKKLDLVLRGMTSSEYEQVRLLEEILQKTERLDDRYVRAERALEEVYSQIRTRASVVERETGPNVDFSMTLQRFDFGTTLAASYTFHHPNQQYASMGAKEFQLTLAYQFGKKSYLVVSTEKNRSGSEEKSYEDFLLYASTFLEKECSSIETHISKERFNFLAAFFGASEESNTGRSGSISVPSPE